MSNYIITDITQILKLGVQCGGYWFRGNSIIVDDLIPKVYRNFNAAHESEYINEFLRLAPIYENNIPKNRLDLLFYMQHYGLPTRLLDWSENIFVALFFCVVDNQNEDGEIWVINPSDLKNHVKSKTDLEKLYEFLINEPFLENKKEKNRYLDSLGIKREDLYPLPIYPNWIDKRIAAQQSVFTIHPEHFNYNNRIVDFYKDARLIERFIIPSKEKLTLELQLFKLGYSYRKIMPDIYGLSLDLQRNTRIKYLPNGYRLKDIIE